MQKSDVLLICAVVYGAPQMGSVGAWTGFAVCVVLWLVYTLKGK